MSPCRDEEAFLHVPPLEKQFLISPPCSPPVGWEQPREDKPVVDYDLLAAMAQLSPGKMQDRIKLKFLYSCWNAKYLLEFISFDELMNKI